MGNEASLEGEGQPGQAGGAGAPASISAPAGGGQLHKPSNGAPAGVMGTGPGPGTNSVQTKPNQTPASAAGPAPPAQSHAPAARRNLQVDLGGGKGASPASSAPTSPYSVPQIAPMPSSKLCPVCKSADLSDAPPNANTCTQCHSLVCNQCGFNPNPHLTQVQEWLCLNCQMQRALGIDMETPRSKSQQQIHSPSQPSKAPPQMATPAPAPPQMATPAPAPLSKPPPQMATPTPKPPLQMATPAPLSKPSPQMATPTPAPLSKPPAPGAIPLPGLAKAPSQPDLSRSAPGPLPQFPRPDHTRSAGSSPSRQPPPPEQPFGKLFGFGASLLNQASSLMSVDPVPSAPPAQAPPSPKPPQKQRQELPKVTCPLCKTELNVGDPTKSPNYNHCTQCHAQVCNLCGFNPTPHLTEKKEWLCLTCQTQRAMSGNLGDLPPVQPAAGPPRSPSPAQPPQRGPPQQAALRPAGPQQKKPSGAQVSGTFSPVRQGAPPSKGSPQTPTKTVPQKQDQGVNKKQALSKVEKDGDVKTASRKGTADRKDEKRSNGTQKPKQDDDSNKSSTQSLSDTGYSSDGISSSQSEITGLIQEDSTKLSERGITEQRSPPSPSELTKLETSMRPLLESHSAHDQGRYRDGRDTSADQDRPRSLSISHDQEFESDEEASDDLSCKLRHDYVEDSSESGLSPLPTRQKKSQKDLTDEEFMRRQILEMSADEEDLDVDSQVKAKRSQKHSGDSGKERRRLTQQSSSFEEDTKSTDGSYKSGDTDDMMASQGGLRRFKTIELNNTNSYNRDMELGADHDLREPELEMESLTGSPEERSRGEYSSTLPATTPSYTSGTSPTSVSSMEDDSDSSPSRRQRLEDAKQQRKARHRSHGPLLPTIEDSSEEDELREEEELLREQEKMRDLEQQRIRSTARKTKRDKEELRAQRRRERSKTPPSNLSPIEDASPTEELRQAAEMEELHRSSCSEYSPSMDSEAEGYDMASKLYKSGSEYNLPTFMSLYSPSEKNSSVSLSAPDKSLKSAEEVYEEMMRKAEMMQKQQQKVPGKQGQQANQAEKKHHLESGRALSPGTSPTQVSAPVSFSPNDPAGRGAQRSHSQSQVRMPSQTSKVGSTIGSPQSQIRQSAPAQSQGKPGSHGTAQTQVQDSGTSLTSKMFSYFKGTSPPTSPSPSPTQSPTRAPAPCASTTGASSQSTQSHHRSGPRLSRQQSSQDSPVMVITLGSGTSSNTTKPITVNSSTSPLSSPTKENQNTNYQTQHSTKSPTQAQKYSAHTSTQQRVNVTPVASSGSGSLPVGNISLCRISTVPGTSRVVEQGTFSPGSIVDLRAPVKPPPVIMTDQGMDLTSLASDSRRYSLESESSPVRHTAVQPLIMNLNSQAPLATATTPTTVSVTVAASMFISQSKQPVIYGDPLQNRVDFGQGVGSAVCLTQTRPVITDPSIPKIDACLENLGIQQQQLQKQQQKLQQQQELLEQQLQQHQQNASFARYNLANQVQPILLKKDVVVSQSMGSGGSTQTAISSCPKTSPLPPQTTSTASAIPTVGHDIYGGVALELKNKPSVMNLATGKPQVMMVQLDESSVQGATVTQIVKREDPKPPLEVLDLTGQIKPESQLACCDVVYKLPFAGTCSGSFTQRVKGAQETDLPAEPGQVVNHQSQPVVDGYQAANTQGTAEECKPFSLPPPARLPPSMSDNNLAASGLQYYHRTDPGDLAVDLSSMKQAYEAGYLGMGAQYGSYTDLRHQGGDSAPTLPLRRYGSMSNINAENSYPSRDFLQESNLAQYSATTAREISRMCAALNSMEQFSNRYNNNPEMLQYGPGRGGPLGRMNLQQGLASIRANLLYGPDGRPTVHSQTLTNLINARQASLRSLYPTAVRTADGMIYSTINTPIASTLPITTQPAPAINPTARGVYGPFPSGNVSAVPLANLTRLPQVTPRMPLTSQAPYRYPAPNSFSVSAQDNSSMGVPFTNTVQEAPVYLGKPTLSSTVSTTELSKGGQSASSLSAQPTQATALPVQSAVKEPHPSAHGPIEGTLPQPQPQTQIQTQLMATSQDQSKNISDTTASASTATSAEEERLRLQQEQLLQLERERVELEKLRQIRLQEELERDRLELQRHREKEHILMQREIQELQTIKQQVLHQQQAERETQLVMQREQLAQQRMQLDQIQSLQQQLQQQLEEQKRQKTAAIEAAAVAAAAEAAAASAAAVAAATSAQGAIQGVMVGGATPQTISIICDQSGRIIPQEGQSVQLLPCADGQVVQTVMSSRLLPSSASEMSLKNSEENVDGRIMRKQNSMPRLKNGSEDESVKTIADCSVQTDDEDAEDKLMSRRRRTRRIADCSVQTDEEDQGDWDNQPIRRRRSRYSKHSESGAENKADASKVTSSIAIQTTSDFSCQTESDQLGRISPAIHITMADTSKVELLHYISAPERTRKGESLACQTDPESQSHVVVAPQLSVPTTVSPYSTSLQLVGATPTKFERRKPDPIEIGYKQQQNDSSSRQPPKSPQVLYSPVSPLSPHRMLETSFTSSEKLNKAHVTPQQKAFTAESPQRHQSVPRPIKNVQRSMSDPKPLSPTSEDPAKAKYSLYQSQTNSVSQMSALQQQNALMRKVKRTLPSPPPEEAPLPIVTPAAPHMYSSSGVSQRVLPRTVQGATKAGLLSELKAVEQESTKLRKQQAELEEEEKEIDAKLRCLEMGITQRKETRVKERERRELAYLRCMGDARDYMSDSELNNLRMAGVVAPGTYEENGLLSRPNTAPLSQFTSELNASYPPTSSYSPYQYPQTQSTATQPPTAAYQQIGFQPPPYPSSSQPQPGTFQPHPPQPSSYQTPVQYQSHTYGQPYESDLGMQPAHQVFQPASAPLSGQTLPYPAFSGQTDMLSAHQRPRQTSIADLEQKLPTNYEVINNPSVPIATSAQETGFSGVYPSTLSNSYGQYRPSDQHMNERIPSPSSGYVNDSVYSSNLEQNIPRNYVMIEDISELTKENMGSSDMSRLGYGNENGLRGPTYGDGSENSYGRTAHTYHNAGDGHGHPSMAGSGSSGYYYDDYKHSSRSSGGMGSQKHSSKNLAPAVSSKRSKHRKQGMEQKISKFSPIEEARDVESDLASYTMTTPTGGSCTVVSRTGGKKSYDQQKYYGSREALEEDDRLYSSGRSRSTGYGMDKISSRDSSGYRSKSYERDAMERSQRGSHGRSGRAAMRPQNSEEESPLSPVGKPVGVGRGSVPDPHDGRNQYGSSHSLPDVQDHHTRDVPKSHVYKPDDPYLADDMHCAVSDSEAYHLGQEETDWFEKPREARSDRSRHHGGSHSTSGRRGNVKHTYHDYDEPPEEDLWPQDDYNHQRHSSSNSSRDHRHHGGSSARHSSRHSSDDPRTSRSSRSHPKDPSVRADSRSTSSMQKRSDPRSAGHRDSGEYSRDPSGHHHGSSGQRGQRPAGSSRRQEASSGPRQQQQGPGDQQPPSQPGQQRGSTPAQQGASKQTADPGSQSLGQGTRSQQPPTQQHGPPPVTTMGATQPTPTAPGAAQQVKPGQASAQARQLPGGPPTAQAAPAMTKLDTATPLPAPTPAVAIGSKAVPQAAKPGQIPVTGIGSKAAPRPGGIGSAAPPPAEGENVLTKILQGGAAEQAGKLGDAVSALGKKFTSFW